MRNGSQSPRYSVAAAAALLVSITGCAEAPTWTESSQDTQRRKAYSNALELARDTAEVDGFASEVSDGGAPAIPGEGVLTHPPQDELDPISEHFVQVYEDERQRWYVNISKASRKYFIRSHTLCWDELGRPVQCVNVRHRDVPPLGAFFVWQNPGQGHGALHFLLGSRASDPSEDQSRLLAPPGQHFAELAGSAEEAAQYLNTSEECRVAHFSRKGVRGQPQIDTVEADAGEQIESPFAPSDDAQITFLGSTWCWGDLSMTFGAYPTRVRRGGITTLRWTSEDAEYCVDPRGREVGSSGSLSLLVHRTATFSMTCHGPAGSVTEHATVSVIPDPPGLCPPWREPCYDEP